MHVLLNRAFFVKTTKNEPCNVFRSKKIRHPKHYLALVKQFHLYRMYRVEPRTEKLKILDRERDPLKLYLR
jgi:hypothetical protein